MSTEPNIPVIFVGNADANSRNESIGLGSGRAPLVLGGEAQLLTQVEYDSFPSRLGVVLQKEGSDVADLNVKEIREELDALGIEYRPNDKKDDLASKLTEARTSQVAFSSAPPETGSGSQLGIGDNPSINPPSL